MKQRYYIQSKGELKRDRDSLRFENANTDSRIPIGRVYDIYAEEGISVSSGALKLLSEEEIMLHIFSYYGNYVGSYIPKEAVLSGKCIVNQASKYSSSDERLRLASLFVEGSIENTRLTLKRYKEDDCCNSAQRLENMKSGIDSFNTVSELMQGEGEARKVYYNCLDHCINGFTLEKRTRQPPKDEINSVMSYLNSLVYAAIVTELYYTRLDQKISFLHEPHERRYSLSLDISEIFKPMIGDRLLVRLFNENRLSSDDFTSKGSGVFLDDDGRKKVLNLFRDRMESTRKHPRSKEYKSIRRWVRMECHSITKDIMDIENYSYTKMR
jgi:CRISPR-associated protein Cas1